MPYEVPRKVYSEHGAAGDDNHSNRPAVDHSPTTINSTRYLFTKHSLEVVVATVVHGAVFRKLHAVARQTRSFYNSDGNQLRREIQVHGAVFRKLHAVARQTRSFYNSDGNQLRREIQRRHIQF
ncbi:hypothetical protein QE152_g2004 [Popillia japonica]|uniref:Uncharacterized protein n=1 Tax=Popillia japonica TaxID=7064 RepID=A0AAW1N483_POPJA